jgi:hypothetical protein
MFTGYKGNAKRLEDIDLPRIGAEIGVGEDELHALIEVETSGTGFDKQGRVKILFEPHRFYRLLGPGSAGNDKLKRAVDAGLAYKNWGARPYPSDSYPRLLQAMEIDETAALKAASWGLPQIMGENHRAAGFDSVQEMVSAFADDEDAQLQAMVRFIQTNHIDDDLRRIEQIKQSGRVPTAADWVPIVRVYNGAGFARNDYHNRAARAFAKWMRIKDTDLPTESIMSSAAREEAENAPPLDAVAPAVAERDDGTQTAPAHPAGAATVEPPAKEVQMTSMSTTTKRLTIGMAGTAIIGAIQQVWQSSQETVLSAGQYALKHLPMVLLILGFAALAFWIYNKAAERKEKRLSKVVDIAADKTKNDVVIT